MKLNIPVIRTYFLAALLALGTCLVSVQKAAAGQTERLSLPSLEMTAGQVLAEIERQTGYLTAYENTAFDTERKVKFATASTTLHDALGTMLTGSGFSYLVRDEYIAIIPGEAAPVAPRRSIYTGQSEKVSDAYRTSNIEEFDTTPRQRILPPPEVVIADSTAVAKDEARSEELPAFTSRDASIRSYAVKPLPKVSVKTNLLHAATLTPNLGADIGLGRRTSLELYAAYNPWKREGKIDDNRKMSHLVLRPEFRWWMCERMNGHFFGANAFYWQYNTGGLKMPLLGFKKAERYEGYAVGAAATYGYHLPFHKRWGVEFSVSVGAARMKHDIYNCAVCSGVSGQKSKWYFGPTNASASLVFIIR